MQTKSNEIQKFDYNQNSFDPSQTVSLKISYLVRVLLSRELDPGRSLKDWETLFLFDPIAFSLSLLDEVKLADAARRVMAML